MRVFAEEEIHDIVTAFPNYELHRVLSRRVGSVSVAVRDHDAESTYVLRIIDPLNVTDNETEFLQPTAHCSKLKALSKIFAKAPGVCIQEALLFGSHSVLHRRPFFQHTLFERLRYHILII
jgi:hypothetical protein